ncbi:tRNA (N6-threonylcarbamoyladenosine(37)-N6)-methyltransferase TrmO [Shewanella sp. 202IG2-18]|uniref:tRNA (N6-threonylcarbamoyladenosine(37)-N6)-methyltransferase TrmO n=1 Tax=Parashewanella hymeniacidonis TaxID=2807618 RepID=UPI00195FE00D|nr:tRNA (N6-threonylcarbamoyladenosine(37)-N6)-methyltransferase TrmO [Parashewanella hymeniacidonis]MBM7071755.1 tRNA (N6-threonylcarbamoyladenosine(37)-N6)-methyltransferase TrmO [Parashewanella hymeniacidonis]
MNSFTQQVEAVGFCRTPFKQKFGIPRQPGLVEAKGFIELSGQYNHSDFIEGIEQYSHLWLLFSFHENLAHGFKAKVRPPRLGGNEKIGVFATRSTFRPNGIGQSVVKLERVINENNQVKLEISGMDLVDGTPILDIKPYIPYSDSIKEANGGMAQEEPELKDVEFTSKAETQLQTFDDHAKLKKLIQQVLAQDPRPAYKQSKPDNKNYFISLYDLNIQWCCVTSIIKVIEVTRLLK